MTRRHLPNDLERLPVIALFAVDAPEREARAVIVGPVAQRFLQEARAHLETDNERQRAYMYVETRRDQKLDKNGRPTSETVKVFESYPGLPGEERWDRVLSEDGFRL